MARGAIALLEDEARHAGFARRAHDLAIERFAEARIVARYRAVYDRVVAARNGH